MSEKLGRKGNALSGTPRNNGASKPGKPVRGIHALYAILIFFGVIFLADGYFMYLAISTHSGVDTANSYRSGLKYNERIAQEQAQKAQGWATDIKLSTANDRLTFTVKDHSGFAVPGLNVSALLSRPTTGAYDRRLILAELEPGQYNSIFSALAPGSWIVNIEATKPRNGKELVVYRLRKRLWLQPKN